MNEERIQYPLLVQACNLVNTRISADPNAASKQLDLVGEAFERLCLLASRPMPTYVAPAAEPEAVPQPPAVPIKKSVQQDAIICLEDGKRFKSLKRHLMTAYGLSPQAYRAKWGLPKDYPMVAPDYAAARSTLAKELGLGRKAPRSLTPLTATQSAAMTEASVAPKKSAGRTRKPILTAKNGRVQHAHG